MGERQRLAVALALPTALLVAMLFAPLDAVAPPSAAGAPSPGARDGVVSQASGSHLPTLRQSTTAPVIADSNDWADVLQLGGITYTAGLLDPGRGLRDDELGTEIGRVQARLSGNARPAGYTLKDGDAAYLDRGTPVYAVNGYRATFRVAAQRQGRLVLFEATLNPRARVARDLLDIDGRVRAITVHRADPRASGQSIDRPEDVSRLMAMVLDARVDPVHTFGRRTAYVSMRLVDGTAVTFQFSEETGSLSRGIVGLPREFAAAIASRT